MALQEVGGDKSSMCRLVLFFCARVSNCGTRGASKRIAYIAHYDETDREIDENKNDWNDCNDFAAAAAASTKIQTNSRKNNRCVTI